MGNAGRQNPREFTSEETGWRNAMIVQEPLRKQWLLRFLPKPVADVCASASPAAILPSLAAPARFATIDVQHTMSMSRLRKLRKVANLTQREVARLVGYASQRAYSDLELGLKRPALGTALACCLLFKSSLEDLFPTLAEGVGRDVVGRARKLLEELASDGKREMTATFIAQVVERLGELRSKQ
jgi:transcriptional regulator with XRE-family HTH domain